PDAHREDVLEGEGSVADVSGADPGEPDGSVGVGAETGLPPGYPGLVPVVWFGPGSRSQTGARATPPAQIQYLYATHLGSALGRAQAGPCHRAVFPADRPARLARQKVDPVASLIDRK